MKRIALKKEGSKVRPVTYAIQVDDGTIDKTTKYHHLSIECALQLMLVKETM